MVLESALASRFKLLGVAAPRRGGDRNGLALIAVDGKPARSFAVGAAVDGEMLLQSVHARGAQLGARGAAAQVTLELPALPLAATGTLPSPATSLPSIAPTGAVTVAPGLAVPTDPQSGEPVPVSAQPSVSNSSAR